MKTVVLLCARIVLAGLAMGLSACNYNNVKNGAATGAGAMEALSQDQLDFNLVKGMVVGPKCLSCHATATGNQGGTNLESYKNLRAVLNRVAYRALEKRDMPPSGLSQAEAGLLRSWIEQGAPETVAGPNTKPDPALDQGPNDWNKVSTKIFLKKCADCHAGETPDAGFDITAVQQVRERASKVFDRVIVRQDMPMAPYPALSPKERRILLQWFDSGMPE